MKFIKFTAVFCLAVFLSSFTHSIVWAQDSEDNSNQKTVEKQTSEKNVVVKADKRDEQVSSNIDNQDSNNIDESYKMFEKRGDDRYRIGFQDVIKIEVYNHANLNQVVSVNSDGTINLFRVDNPIRAVCRTEKELQDLVAELYTSFLKKPFVNVRAIEQKSQPLAVVGAVKKPGVFYLNRKIRLIQLLSMAEGQDPEIAGSRIQIARLGNEAGCVERDTTDSTPDVEFLSYDLYQILEGKQNPWVQPGDIVSVLEAEQAYVVGNVVNEAEKIPLREPVTLMQAIAMAGGVSQNAKTSKVKIQRQQPGTPVRKEMIFDLKEIASNEVEDPVLQANDIVEVPTDNFKSARNAFIKAITGGLGNIFYRFPL